jgi:hypothetical protein
MDMMRLSGIWLLRLGKAQPSSLPAYLLNGHRSDENAPYTSVFSSLSSFDLPLRF